MKLLIFFIKRVEILSLINGLIKNDCWYGLIIRNQLDSRGETASIFTQKYKKNSILHGKLVSSVQW